MAAQSWPKRTKSFQQIAVGDVDSRQLLLRKGGAVGHDPAVDGNTSRGPEDGLWKKKIPGPRYLDQKGSLGRGRGQPVLPYSRSLPDKGVRPDVTTYRQFNLACARIFEPERENNFIVPSILGARDAVT